MHACMQYINGGRPAAKYTHLGSWGGDPRVNEKNSSPALHIHKGFRSLHCQRMGVH